MLIHVLLSVLSGPFFQFTPPSSDVQMLPVARPEPPASEANPAPVKKPAIAASLVPSALEVVSPQYLSSIFAGPFFQFTPPSLDVQMLPRNSVAASLVPSALEVILVQGRPSMEPSSLSGPRRIQFTPPSSDVHMLPRNLTAASFMPSALEVMSRRRPSSPSHGSVKETDQLSPLSSEIQIDKDSYSFEANATSFIPSALEVIAENLAFVPGELSSGFRELHVVPPLSDIQTSEEPSTVARIMPSALEVISDTPSSPDTGTSTELQSAPPLSDVKMRPPS